MNRPFKHEHANHEQTIDRANEKLKVVLLNRMDESQARLDNKDEPPTIDEQRLIFLNISRWQKRLDQIDRAD